MKNYLRNINYGVAFAFLSFSVDTQKLNFLQSLSLNLTCLNVLNLESFRSKPVRFVLGLFFLLPFTITAQQKFTLQECIQYAIENNISIKQNRLQQRVADVQYKQSKLSKYPSASFSNNDGYRFGKSQNPSTGILENRNFFSVGLNFTSSIEIFNWYSKRNSILANQWEVEAIKAGIQKLNDDITLLIINSYLQILLAKEQEKIANVQVQQSNSQLNIVQKKVNAGALSELNAAELEAQVAKDSANLIAAKGNVEQTMYMLKSFMNIDATQPLEIEELSADIVGENFTNHKLEIVYATALNNSPQQRINEFKIKAAKANLLVAKGAMYPTISAYGSLGTNYGYSRTPIFQQIFSGYQPSGLVISNGSGGYNDVQRPVLVNGDKSGYLISEPIGSQFNSNFGQSIGINISVPIFNGWSAKANYERAKINIKILNLQKEQDSQTIKQEIYQAYNAAVVAMEKITSSKKAVDFAQRSFDFAGKRYNAGMLTTFELITDQNNLFKAKLEFALNQFDYVFKIKVLEFYKGERLKL